MLEHVEESGGGRVFLTLTLLQPLLVGVGQRTVRAAQTEKMNVHLRQSIIVFGFQVTDGAGREQRRKRAVQAHGFTTRIGAGAQGDGRRVEPFQQADSLLEIEGVGLHKQPRG